MEIKILNQPGFAEVVSCFDPESGLRAIIAIHSTKLGPALGGIRMLPYADEEAALKDVLLLAKAMTYKAAAAHLKLGGGKAVIIGDPVIRKTVPLLHAMGQFIDQFQGRYIAAKDAGITTDDLVEISKVTKHVTGLPKSMNGSGDPSPWTAIGILEGIRACVEEQMGRNRLQGLTAAIQGIGHVGFSLAELLHEKKVKLIISDTNPELLQRAQKVLHAEIVSPDEIYSVKAHIFSPCALGAIISDETISKLQCSIIAGGANNQLADEAKHDQELAKRRILYAPDYIINAGGLINIYARDILKENDSLPRIQKIHDNLIEIFHIAREKKIGTAQAANQITETFLESLPLNR